MLTHEEVGMKRTFQFSDGAIKKMAKQSTSAFAYRLHFNDSILNSLSASGYITKAQAIELDGKEVILDNASVFSIYENLQRIAG